MARRKQRRATVLRPVAWAVTALAVWSMGHMPGPGGSGLGLILAGSLGTYLYVTRNGS